MVISRDCLIFETNFRQSEKLVEIDTKFSFDISQYHSAPAILETTDTSHRDEEIHVLIEHTRTIVNRNSSQEQS